MSEATVSRFLIARRSLSNSSLLLYTVYSAISSW